MARKQNHHPLYEITEAVLARPQLFFSGIEKQDWPVAVYECLKL
jgi:hypothetical protein